MLPVMMHEVKVTENRPPAPNEGRGAWSDPLKRLSYEGFMSAGLPGCWPQTTPTAGRASSARRPHWGQVQLFDVGGTVRIAAIMASSRSLLGGRP